LGDLWASRKMDEAILNVDGGSLKQRACLELIPLLFV